MTKQQLQTALAVLVYLGGIVGANLFAASFGPSAVPIVTFTLIGLDLSLRDFLQLTMKKWSMFAMIFLGGAISYILVPEAGIIAIASGTAFTSAALVDWTVFALLKGKWIVRANLSNVAGAMVDSSVFITIAFGTFMPQEIALSVVSKVAGGFFWSYILAIIFRKRIAAIDERGGQTL
ncbi:MAG: VUT family protein [Ignavibacteria bacterium]|jgi:hypothetical protein